MFCGVCYALLDDAVKASRRSAYKFGNPKRALLLGIEALTALQESGVAVPERKMEKRKAEGRGA